MTTERKLTFNEWLRQKHYFGGKQSLVWWIEVNYPQEQWKHILNEWRANYYLWYNDNFIHGKEVK